MKTFAFGLRLSIFSTSVAAGVLLAGLALAAGPDRQSVYLTVAGPLEVIRQGADHVVTLRGLTIHKTVGEPLTAQSYMSVGEPDDGFDAVLLRRGLGNVDCPVVYDLITVGADGKSALVQSFNNCSRLVDARAVGDKLMFVLENKTGKTEVLEYNDEDRKHSVPVKLKKSALPKPETPN
ncbi:hypothetical protein [Desulfolutivibrio sulfoxidireducens]|uniref:hypothetical protein n=1 Tax=Desulfolutivibrio sulfoxidireducens TaxID=2773299 RepID=UPI00159DCF84|nr:hypothetical protein [Desulfolutivibrio sulfoxidireducens]QLA15189.1 hypothetical protein GD605_03070 [Desulfolutivibrio sulfoxidireducens]QLA18760.1 hypothetical protein GD604_02965 [Desulfolutivibrio sulfoxidireducens]